MLGLANLDQQMEVACVSLINEIDQGFMPEAEQRLLVAEFGLLDTQVTPSARRSIAWCSGNADMLFWVE